MVLADAGISGRRQDYGMTWPWSSNRRFLIAVSSSNAAAGLLRREVENACLGSWGLTLREGFREGRRGAVGVIAALHDRGPALEKGGGLRLVIPVLTDALVERDAGGRLAGG
jgi:hypothetical protein